MNENKFSPLIPQTRKITKLLVHNSGPKGISNLERIELEKRLIEEFEIKSYEYGIYTGEITPSEPDETNETNESCLPSTAQEEPLEVIELDEKVIYNLKDEA